MVVPLVEAAVGVATTVGLALAAIAARALTPSAGAAAAAFGSVIVVLAGFPYLLLLVLFVVASVLATRYAFDEKQRRNVQEGLHGERGVSNVLAHVLLPTALVLVATIWPAALPGPALLILFTSALAFGTADTFASEFGVLAGRARSILSFRPVPAGTNGGISGIGELWALAGALATALAAAALALAFSAPLPRPGLLVLGATAAGFLACQVDSVLGEALENRGLLTKGTTNFAGMLSAVLLAFGMLAAAGVPR